MRVERRERGTTMPRSLNRRDACKAILSKGAELEFELERISFVPLYQRTGFYCWMIQLPILGVVPDAPLGAIRDPSWSEYTDRWVPALALKALGRDDSNLEAPI